MNLFNAITVEEARRIIVDSFKGYEAWIEVEVTEALNMIAAEDVYSDEELPHFNRSTVDGYCIKARDIYGATESIPGIFDVVGEVDMGREAMQCIGSGQAAYVPTGGMLPVGGDAVVMIEYSEDYGDGTIGLCKPVGVLENTIQRGSDIGYKDIIIEKGTKLTPAHIGALGAVGINRIRVSRPLRIAILSTGDEIVAPTTAPKPGQIRDINTYTLASMAKNLGCEITRTEVVVDEFEILLDRIKRAHGDSDIVLVSGGSSVGTKDYTARAIDSCGSPGVLAHGITIKPGKPTIIGCVDSKAIIGMPGQPVSAMIVFTALVEPLIKTMLGQKNEIKDYIGGRIIQNVPAAPGRETYQMVRISEGADGIDIKPLYGKSGMISLISRANGYVIIPEDSEGLVKGSFAKAYRI